MREYGKIPNSIWRFQKITTVKNSLCTTFSSRYTLRCSVWQTILHVELQKMYKINILPKGLWHVLIHSLKNNYHLQKWMRILILLCKKLMSEAKSNLAKSKEQNLVKGQSARGPSWTNNCTRSIKGNPTDS